MQLHAQLFSTKLQDTVDAIRNEADSNLSSFESGLSFTHTFKKHPITRYVDDCGLKLPLDQLDAGSGDGNIRPIEILKQLESSSSMTDDFRSRFLLLLARCQKLIEASKLDASAWCSVVQQVRDAVEGVNLSRPVTKPLSALDDQIRVLGRKNSELSAEEAQTYEDGEVAENEVIMAQRIAIMEGISDLITQKFHLIDDEKTQILGKHQSELEGALSTVREFVESYRSAASAQKSKVQFDIDALQRTLSKTQRDNQVARDSYAASRGGSDRRLAENASRQAMVWAQIHELEKELSSLAGARRDEVDRRVKLIEREERREMEVRNFEMFAEEHHSRLTEVFRSCEAREYVAEMLEETCVGVCEVASRAVSQAAERMVSFESAAHVEHFKHFREHYLLLGKLQFMKERMLDEYVQRAQVAQSLQELAMDSYNPQAREFALEKQRLEDQILEITNELDVIRKKADLYVEAFKPTEFALRHSSRPFLHPVQELAQLNVGRGRRIAQYHALNVAGFALPSNAVIDTSDAYVAAEKKNLDEVKETRQAHKSNLSSRSPVPEVAQSTTEPSNLRQMLSERRGVGLD